MIVQAGTVGVFDGLPSEGFESNFPSDDAFYSLRYSKLTERLTAAGGPTIAEALFASAQAKAWRDATALATARAAQLGLSILTNMLPEVSWLKGSGQSAVRQGLWAPVTFPPSANPAKLQQALAQAGLDLALSAVQAIPVVGGVLKAAIGVGRLLYRFFNRPDPEVPPLVIPWDLYSKGIDEDLVKRLLIEAYSALADYTDVFMPPTEPRPWLLGQGIKGGQPVDGGQVFAPVDQKGLPVFTSGLGAMPGTFRVGGHIQRVLWRTGSNNPKLSRFFRDYYTAEIPWGSSTTDTGDYFPALAQATAGLWQQFQKAGTPTMYMIDPMRVKSAWSTWFQFMFDSAFGRYPQDPSSGELVAPYIAVYKAHSKGETASWRLGIRGLERPMPAPFVTPAIFKNGPATEDTRTRCLYIANAKTHTVHEDMNYRSFSYLDAKGQTAIAEARRWYAVKAGVSPCNRPPGELCPDDLIPEGFVCVPWPTGTELLSGYGRPDEKIIAPACDRLHQLQRRCLESTLACAYVRPDGDKKFGAFADKELAARCIEVRKILLKHPARFKIWLKDVAPIDPEFEQALRDSGVNNTPGQMGPGVGAGPGGVLEEEEPLPEPLPPVFGVAFDNLPPQTYSLFPLGAN